MESRGISNLFLNDRNFVWHINLIMYFSTWGIYWGEDLGHWKNLGNSVTKNPHCAGARTVPALYGCGPHSNLIFKGHWTLIFRKNLKKKFFPCFFFLLFYSQFRI